jgi:hypothetical protein
VIKLSRQSALLIALGILLATRFLVLPILSWQSEQIELLESQGRQLDKTLEIADRYDEYQGQLRDLEASVSAAAAYFYADDDDLKVRVQRDLEGYFDKHNIEIRGFNWTLDEKGSVRQLRAVIKFKGAVKDAITLHWDLARSRMIIKEVQSVHRITQPPSGSLGVLDGEVTLTLYALGLKQSSVEDNL